MLRCLLFTLLVALVLSTGGCGSPAKSPESSAARTVSVSIPPAPHPLRGHRGAGDDYRTSGYVPRPVRTRPYVRGLLNKLPGPVTVDDAGVLLFKRDGKRYYHPVATIHYALSELDIASRTDSKQALRAAEVNARKLLDVAVHRDGETYFPYRFDFPLGKAGTQPVLAPWWSAMAQAQAVSLFVRLHQLTGKKLWRTAADQAFATLDDRGPRTGPWSVYVDGHHYLWFEEYAGNTKPLLVLNGDMYAIFGVWDYYRLTHSAKAKRLFDAAVTTLREYLPLYRAAGGGVSYYCLRAPFCQTERWRNPKYHLIVTRQMRVVADMTDDAWFDRQADLFAKDFSGPLEPAA